MPKSQPPRRKFKPVQKLSDMQAQMEMVEKATHPAYAALDLGYRKQANETHGHSLVSFLLIGEMIARIQKADQICLPAIENAMEFIAKANGDLNALGDYEQVFHGLNVAFELAKACPEEVYDEAISFCDQMIRAQNAQPGETLQ